MSEQIPEKCPKCGAKRVDSEYAQAFACGTLASSSGRFYHTATCSSFTDLRKPLDDDRDILAKRVAELESALAKVRFYGATGCLQDSLDEAKRIAEEALKKSS